jgi:predicted phage terminase large subunit-like protein
LQARRFLVHRNGPALWPGRKPLAEVLDLKATTPESIWETTYQGNPTPPAGTVFRRGWWRGRNRYDAGDQGLLNWCVGRWISWDTALKETESSAYTVAVVGELWPDYRMAIRYVFRDRLAFPALPDEIERLAKRFNRDGKLRGVIIEDKASGTSAYQTLMATAPGWLRGLLVAFLPTVSKFQRASQAAVWCKNGSVLLPEPGASVPWLMDFEEEIFDFPNAAFADQVDGLSQLVIFTENLLESGWRARSGH